MAKCDIHGVDMVPNCAAGYMNSSVSEGAKRKKKGWRGSLCIRSSSSSCCCFFNQSHKRTVIDCQECLGFQHGSLRFVYIWEAYQHLIRFAHIGTVTLLFL